MEEDSPYHFSRCRLKAFFHAKMGGGTLPTAETVLHAIRTGAPQLRYLVGRDEDRIADFGIADDEAFYDRMARRFGVDLWRKPAKPETEG